MGRVAGKVAIVTGATSKAGIGFATARALVREGATVVLTGTNEPEIIARGKELSALGPAIGVRQNVAREDDWQKILALTLESFGKLDILINNAAISRPQLLEDTDLETWHQIIDVNLTGTFLGCKHAVGVMRRQETGGVIVNVASVVGYDGQRKSSSYSSSKGGIRALTKVIAMENGREGVRCNTIVPGVIVTDIYKPFLQKNPRHLDNHLAASPLGRLGEPDDIAYAALYLSSDEAKFVTGAELLVDAGITCQ